MMRAAKDTELHSTSLTPFALTRALRAFISKGIVKLPIHLSRHSLRILSMSA
jgi:hypothetical protein